MRDPALGLERRRAALPRSDRAPLSAPSLMPGGRTRAAPASPPALGKPKRPAKISLISDSVFLLTDPQMTPGGKKGDEAHRSAARVPRGLGGTPGAKG